MMIFSQNGNPIAVDLELGDYGISLEDQKIGRGIEYPCGELASCYGYFDDGTINYKTTKFYVFDGNLVCSEDFKFNPETVQVLQSEDYRFGTRKYIPTYADNQMVSDNVYKYSHSRQSSLYGFKWYKKQFYIKGNQIGFANSGEFHVLENSSRIDLNTFTPIVNNFFYDKNGVYAITFAVGIEENKPLSVSFKKIQNTKKVTFEIKPDYVIINDSIYDYEEGYKFKPLQLDRTKLHRIIKNDYDGGVILFDGKNVYDRQLSHYSFGKKDCLESYQLDDIQCLVSDLTSLELLLDTYYSEYRYDEKLSTIYLNSDFLNEDFRDLPWLDGKIYHSSNGFYFTDFEMESFLVKNVKILDINTEKYEDLDLSEYKHIKDYYYCYKGVLYGNRSKVIAKNVNPNTIRIIGNDYIFNDKRCLNQEIDVKGLNLKSLKILKFKNGKKSDFLIGDNFLIYEDLVLRNINPEDVKLITEQAVKIKNKLIVDGIAYNLNELSLPEIIFLD